jgi:hypothetical protein
VFGAQDALEPTTSSAVVWLQLGATQHRYHTHVKHLRVSTKLVLLLQTLVNNGWTFQLDKINGQAKIILNKTSL